MPCGWASWAWKFKKYYDFDLKKAEIEGWQNTLKTKYKNHSLYKQQLRSISGEIRRKHNGERYRSWDFHTDFLYKNE